MKADVLNQQNKKVEEIDLPDGIFNVKWNSDLVHQALTAQLANRRENLAHAKDRSEVRGGGKKPWRQKGTGRARHGSSRSPIWRGGGATHGPLKERVFAKKINKKMNRLAIFSILSKKLENREIKIVDSIKPESPKTKIMISLLKNLVDSKKPKALLIASSGNKKINQAVSNIKGISAIASKSLNVYDLLKNKNVILEKDAVEEIKNHYAQ